MVVGGRQQHDSMTQPDARGALTARRKKDLGSRGMRVLFEKVMLDFPHVVDSEPVGEFDLVECILKEFQFRPGRPWAGKLVFVEGSELHAAMVTPCAKIPTALRARPLTGSVLPCRCPRSCAARSTWDRTF